MEGSNLRLLFALDALLSESSVTGAAERLEISAPAMSRALGRLRASIGDPLLVRAGRRLVPTPAALALRGEVREVLERAQRVLQPSAGAEPAAVRGRYTVRCSDALAGTFAASIVALTARRSAQLVLRFVAEGDEDVESLRDGRVHVDFGVIDALGLEIRTQVLYRDRFVGAVRPAHPLARRAGIAAFARADHVVPSRRGRDWTPVDAALQKRGYARRVIATVPSMYAALAMTLRSDIVACVPETTCGPAIAQLGLRTFALPVPTEPVTVSAAWHPRYDADQGVRLIREAIEEACATAKG